MEPGSKSAVGGAVAVEGGRMKDDGEGGSSSEAVSLDMRMEIIEDGLSESSRDLEFGR